MPDHKGKNRKPRDCCVPQKKKIAAVVPRGQGSSVGKRTMMKFYRSPPAKQTIKIRTIS